MGRVGILNVGAGDTKLVFDRNNPQDMIRSARIVRDMLRRGYALLVDSGQKDADGRPIYTRAYDFDESKCEYIIADLDPQAHQKSDGEENEPKSQDAPHRGEAPISDAAKLRGKGGGPRGPKKRVHAADVNSVAVAKSAGG